MNNQAVSKVTPNVTAQFEIITPETAKRLLGHNHSNRPVNEANVSICAHEMNRDNWRQVGDTIKISENSDLQDAQHRLLAVIKSGKPQEFLVVRGLENDVFKYIDTGKPRSPSDVLGVQGIKNPGSIAAIAKFVILFKRGGRTKGVLGQGQKANKLTNQDISIFVLDNLKSLTESRGIGFLKSNTLVPSNILAGMHYTLKAINESQADDFCTKLAEGTELKNTDPIFILRKVLLQNIQSTRKMNDGERLALICKAWNFYRKGTAIQQLRWVEQTEDFPNPV